MLFIVHHTSAGNPASAPEKSRERGPARWSSVPACSRRVRICEHPFRPSRPFSQTAVRSREIWTLPMSGSSHRNLRFRLRSIMPGQLAAISSGPRGAGVAFRTDGPHILVLPPYEFPPVRAGHYDFRVARKSLLVKKLSAPQIDVLTRSRSAFEIEYPGVAVKAEKVGIERFPGKEPAA